MCVFFFMETPCIIEPPVAAGLSENQRNTHAHHTDVSYCARRNPSANRKQEAPLPRRAQRVRRA